MKIMKRIFLKWNKNLKIKRVKMLKNITKNLKKLKMLIRFSRKQPKNITAAAITSIMDTTAMPKRSIMLSITKRRSTTTKNNRTRVMSRDMLITMRSQRITLDFMEIKNLAIPTMKDTLTRNRPKKTMTLIQDSKVQLHKQIDLNVGLKN